MRPFARMLGGRFLAAAALGLGLVAVPVASRPPPQSPRRAPTTSRSEFAFTACATFLDARGAYAGHEVCSGSPWLNGTTLPVTDSYHPNRSGYAQGYLRLLRGTAT